MTDTGPQGTVCIAFASGCPRAEVDTALLFDYFEANGWETSDSIEDADLVVVTSCGVDIEHEDQSLRLLDAAQRRRSPGSRMVVVGCAAGINEADLEERFDATLVPPRNASLMDEVIDASVPLGSVTDPSRIEPYVTRASGCFENADRRAGDTGLTRLAHTVLVDSGVRESITRLGRARTVPEVPPEEEYTLRVAWGCMGECAFCAIRFACGPLRSKPLDSVLAEYEEGCRAGFEEFRLVAQDLGAYGQDIGSNVVELLTALLETSETSRFNLVDLGAKWFLEYSDALIRLLGEHAPRIRRLVVPVQSGSDRVLELMQRGHTAAETVATFQAMRAAIPDAEFSTHALVGFPGETDEDFEMTLDFLRAVRFDRVDIWDYTDRPGAPATGMPDKVPQAVIRSRSRRIRTEFDGRIAGLEYRARCWLSRD